MPSLHAVVMAGGAGTRFWPASRSARPKQVLPLAGGRPLLRATVDRLAGLAPPERTWVVTNERQAAAVRTLVPELPPGHVVVEPEPRDTAPCIALAAATIAALDPDATMLVTPADHLVEPVATFHGLVQRAVVLASDDRTLVTFGIAPTRPATGYGYIERGPALDDGTPTAWQVARFQEKPDAATARGFLASGRHLWNSGIFVWTVHGLLRAMHDTHPELAACTERMIEAARSAPSELAGIFAAAPRTSIDYAVMERAPAVAVVRADLKWDDVGGFGAIGRLGSDDGAGNRSVLAGGASQLALESRGNLVYAEEPRTICLFGVEDLVVVDTRDALLVCPKRRADELKRLVQHVEASRPDLL